MKALLPEFYSNGTETINLSMPETVVVFDTNVLLNLYRYPMGASEDILRLMESLGDKVWLPYHVALEYQRNRLFVIAEQKKRFREVRATVEKGISSLEGDLGKLQLIKKHSTIDIKELITDLHLAKDKFFATLATKESEQRDVSDDDPTRNRLDAIFNGRIGSGPDMKWVKEIEQDGKVRFDAQCPPGYRDRTKEGELFFHRGVSYKHELGDLILWKQLVEYAKQKSLNQVIFVTDDEKEDWWATVDSGGAKRIGPRPELIEEIKRESGTNIFVMLTSERFARIFAKLLNIGLQANTVEQVTDVKSTLSEVVTVACPSCQKTTTVRLGFLPPSSAIQFCGACKVRFHVHRAWDGGVFTKAWGSREPVASKSSELFIPKHRVEAACPKCGCLVPANIRGDELSTQRYCMTCCSLLTIGSNGNVITCEASSPLQVAKISKQGTFTFLSCPNCEEVPPLKPLWRDATTVRAVCPSCERLIEGKESPVV